MSEIQPIVFFQDDYDRASNAHRGVSMFPDEAGRRSLAHFNQVVETTTTISRDKARASGVLDEYDECALKVQQRALVLYWHYLDRKSHVLSWAITGRGNFPTARNDKNFERERAAYKNFTDYMSKAERRLRRIAEASEIVRVGDSAAADDTAAKLEAATALLGAYKLVNKVARIGGDTAVAEALRDMPADTRGKIEDYFRYSHGSGSPVPAFALTNQRARIKRLKAKAHTVEQIATADLDDVVIVGAEFEFDLVDNRVRIRHAEKPSAEVIAELKSAAFRWSPRNQAWQQPITPVAIAKVRRLADRWSGAQGRLQQDGDA